MKKVFLDYSDWKAILFGDSGLPLMDLIISVNWLLVMMLLLY